MSETGPRWITEADVVSVMDMPRAIRALEVGLLAEARGAAMNMAKTHVEWGGHGTLHAIGAAFPEAELVGTKTWAHTPGGATPLLILYDSRTGALKAVVEAFALGQLRTGAASGVATRLLAADAADELAIVGTGKQSMPQIAAVAAVRRLRRVRVFGRDPERRARCVARVAEEIGVEAVEASSIAEAVRDAPIVTVVTRAREPFLTAAMVAHGAHINAVGAIVPSGAEVAGDVLARCTHVVVDSPPQARRLSKELMDYYGSDDAAWQRVRPLSALVAAGEHRTDADDVTLFKSLGMGISDLALAVEIYGATVRAGLGTPLAPPRPAPPRLRGEYQGRV
jgi:ornithine cyclodeaminase